MSGDDWLRRFTEQEPEDDSPPETAAPVDQVLEEDTLVRVLLDESGVVRDVVLGETWRESIGPQALGDALLTAANDAVMSRLATQVAAIDFDAAPAVVTRADAPDAQGDPTSAIAEATVTEVLDLAGRFDADLAVYIEQLKRQLNTAPNSGEGANRRIVVTVAAGQFGSVQVDAGWAEYARDSEVRAEALSAFETAVRATVSAQQTAVQPPASIARLQELASDPQALCRQLGLVQPARNPSTERNGHGSTNR